MKKNLILLMAIGVLSATACFGFQISANGYEVSDEEFKRLTKVSMVVYFGDNIPAEMTDNWGLDNWRIRVNLARKSEKWMREKGLAK